MAAHSHHNEDHGHVGDIPKAQTKAIWKTFVILCVITAIEFAFAFMMEAGTLRNAIFIGLTILKAFYIVGEFMHLKHETKGLIWAILVPTILLCWLLVALLVEGTFYGDSVYNYFK
ncbi:MULTISPECIES: cytochrome C oxidase subunit IV family protein [Rufibacter]|uniref:Caa(3)-type oxidase subunit IV n=1 Tax=Rufibacter quisquiliarum TaxID=1549639 RepID=A0A839GX63_9BACT|nr:MULTISPECIES: cytochrome C oxidase subunit IV family protein [Rufibacter]MBA9079018.1 caa(3)-type oxidase subunit IV [Rufibacter quisquiliarum]